MKKLSLFVVLGVLLGTLTAGSALAEPSAQGTINWGTVRVCSDTDEVQVYVTITGVQSANWWARLWVGDAWAWFSRSKSTPKLTAGQTGNLKIERRASYNITDGMSYWVEVNVYSGVKPAIDSIILYEVRQIEAGPCYGEAAVVDAMAAWRDNNVFMDLTPFGAPVEFNGIFLIGGAVVRGDVGEVYEVGYWSDGAYLALGWFDDDGNVAADPNGPLTDAQLSTLVRFLGW